MDLFLVGQMKVRALGEIHVSDDCCDQDIEEASIENDGADLTIYLNDSWIILSVEDIKKVLK